MLVNLSAFPPSVYSQLLPYPFPFSSSLHALISIASSFLSAPSLSPFPLLASLFSPVRPLHSLMSNHFLSSSSIFPYIPLLYPYLSYNSTSPLSVPSPVCIMWSAPSQKSQRSGALRGLVGIDGQEGGVELQVCGSCGRAKGREYGLG